MAINVNLPYFASTYTQHEYILRCQPFFRQPDVVGTVHESENELEDIDPPEASIKLKKLKASGP